MADQAHLRASDADREKVAERLRQAATEGRLTADELEDRLHNAFSARTYGELEPLVADLPGTAPARALQPAYAKTSGMAIASLALGVFWMWGLGSVIALCLGLMARREITRSEGRLTGRGLATAGIVLGALGLLGAAAMALFTIAHGFVHHEIYYR